MGNLNRGLLAHVHPVALLVLVSSVLCAQPRNAPMDEIGRTNLPAQPVGANDLIAVSVYNAPELSRTIRVDSDGSIALPMLKQQVSAAGLLPRKLEAAIIAALIDEELLVDPIVKVTVVEYHSRPISVVGSVKKPLTFQAVGKVTLLDALARAEGLTPDAGLEILVSHAGESADGLVRRIPVRGLLDTADPELNLALTGGEEIRVPEAGKIYVVGNVKRPGAFAVRDSTEPSVLKMLALAEGLLPYAAREAYIYRREPASGAKNEIPIALDKLMKRQAGDVPLEVNDILYIPDNSGRRTGFAALEKILLFGSTAGATALIYRGVR